MQAPGEGLLLRLWETIAEKGIGSLLKPWQTRREGRAQLDVRREEILMLAQAECDAEDIRAGRLHLASDGVLRALPSPANDKADRLQITPLNPEYAAQAITQIANQNLVADAIRSEVNLANTLLVTEHELENDSQPPPDEKIDDDWLHRWRESAGKVSSKELQQLWGKVLAGELKSPGAFSLRLLDFLRNLSTQEAQKIAKLLPFIVSGVLVTTDDEAFLNEAGIGFSFQLAMQEIGLLAGVESIGLTVTWGSQESDRFFRPLVSHNRVLLVTHEDRAKTIELRVRQVTSLGNQILRLGNFEADEAYLRRVGQAICKMGFEVQLARFVKQAECRGRFFDAEQLSVE